MLTTTLLQLALAAPTPSTAPRIQADAGAPPANIVVVLVDDVGLADLGCYLGPDGVTPHIDSLAREGTLFERAYATASICSPARAGLLTGRYQQRFGHENNTGPLARQTELGIGLPVGETTLADRLAAAGYATGLVGKWHLGAGEGFHPLERGFQSFFGHLGGGHDYGTWEDPENGPIYRDREVVGGNTYLTDAFSDEAVRFIGEHADGPFFLLLSYNAIHEPYQAPQNYLRRFSHFTDKGRRVRAAMLAAVDDGVGRILAALAEHGVEENTLVVFVADNGPPKEAEELVPSPLRGGKLKLYERGVRVPLLARWPARLDAGRRVATAVSCLDLAPTCVEASGSPTARGEAADEAFDGQSLLASLEPGAVRERPFFWRQGVKAAASDGRLKIIRKRTGVYEGYAVGDDPGERFGLDGGGAEFAGLRSALEAWEAGLADPLWDWSESER